MATVINNPATGTTSNDSSAGTVVAILVGLALVALIVFAGIPWARGWRGTSSNTTINSSLSIPNAVTPGSGSGSSGGGTGGQAPSGQGVGSQP